MYRAWCFTLNNPEPEGLPGFPDYVRYAVWQKETSKTGTPHFQGYVELHRPQRLPAMKKWLKLAHWEPRRGTPEQARAYCMKEDSRLEGPWEHGKCVGQGDRTDLEFAKDYILDGHTKDEVYLNMERIAAQYPKWVDHLLGYAKRQRVDKVTDIEARPWQARLIETLTGPADPRKILWFYDEKGGAGKSHLARYLVDTKGAFYSRGGKGMDITYAYDYQDIVILDYVRDAVDYVNYGVLEMFKDGMVQSNKYESVLKRCNCPHVVVFANFMPDMTKWSQDRYEITTL